MVTFRLIEETGQYLTYWYFPNGNEDEMYGIILIDKLNETVEIQKMAHDDFSHIVTVDEQNELRNSINETRKEEGLPLLTEEEWPSATMEDMDYYHQTYGLIQDFTAEKDWKCW